MISRRNDGYIDPLSHSFTRYVCIFNVKFLCVLEIGEESNVASVMISVMDFLNGLDLIKFSKNFLLFACKV